MAIVSAIQEAQKDNLKSFNDYMMKVMEVSALLWVHVMFLILLSFFHAHNLLLCWQEVQTV